MKNYHKTFDETRLWVRRVGGKFQGFINLKNKQKFLNYHRHASS